MVGMVAFQVTWFHSINADQFWAGLMPLALGSWALLKASTVPPILKVSDSLL